MNMLSKAVLSGMFAACIATSAQAGTIVAGTTGLASPAATITFDEILLAPDTLVTNQYAGLGVIFSPAAYYSPQNGFGNVQGNDLGNFTFNSGASFFAPFTLTFTTLQSDVAFAMASNTTDYLFEAKLGGNLVDSFQAVVDTSSADYYGFTGLVFDSITITTLNQDFWLLDNIQMGTAPTGIPEPATLALFGAGLAGLAARRRKKAKSAGA